MSISNVESGDTGLKAEPVGSVGKVKVAGGGSEGPHAKTSRNLGHYRWREWNITQMTIKTIEEGLSNLADFRFMFSFESHQAGTQQKSNLRPHLNSAHPFVLRLARRNKTSISSSLPENELVSKTAPRLWRPLKQDAYQS